MAEAQRKTRSDKGVQRTPHAKDDHNFSFRLNPHIEGEKVVIEQLGEWLESEDENGKSPSLRSIIVGLVLHYIGKPLPSATVDVSVLGLDELTAHFEAQLGRVDSIIDRLSQLGVTQVKAPKQKAANAVSPAYLSNLKKALRGEDEG